MSEKRNGVVSKCRHGRLIIDMSDSIMNGERLNRYHLNQVIEYIRSKGEFPFDMEDVDEVPYSVLGFFKVFDFFSSEELSELKKELSQIALSEEYREVTRLAFKEGELNTEVSQ